jgi:hypothetical protein
MIRVVPILRGVRVGAILGRAAVPVAVPRFCLIDDRTMSVECSMVKHVDAMQVADRVKQRRYGKESLGSKELDERCRCGFVGHRLCSYTNLKLDRAVV